MRNIYLTAALLVLGGCAMPSSDMQNNRYMERLAEPVPASMVGDWTGTMGPYLMTIRLAKDGNGVMCWAYSRNNTVYNLKYSAGNVYLQDGTRMELSQAGDLLTAKSPYLGTTSAKLYPDNGLAQAAPFCKQSL